RKMIRSKTPMLVTFFLSLLVSGCGGADPQSSEAAILDQGQETQELLLKRQCCILRFSDSVRCGDIKSTKIGAALLCQTNKITQGARSAAVHSGRCSAQEACASSPPGDDGS